MFTIYAIGARFSRHPSLITVPAYRAGDPFAIEALRLMFDPQGRLISKANIATVQALCFLLEFPYLQAAHDQDLRGEYLRFTISTVYVIYKL